MLTKYLDTNFILRLILKDNSEQFQEVENLLKLANQNILTIWKNSKIKFGMTKKDDFLII